MFFSTRFAEIAASTAQCSQKYSLLITVKVDMCPGYPVPGLSVAPAAVRLEEGKLAAWGGSCANARIEPNAIISSCVVTGGIGRVPKLFEMKLSRGFLFRSYGISSISMQQISLLTGTNYVALTGKRNERNVRPIIQGGIQFLLFLLCKCETELLSF